MRQREAGTWNLDNLRARSFFKLFWLPIFYSWILWKFYYNSSFHARIWIFLTFIAFYWPWKFLNTDYWKKQINYNLLLRPLYVAYWTYSTNSWILINKFYWTYSSKNSKLTNKMNMCERWTVNKFSSSNGSGELITSWVDKIKNKQFTFLFHYCCILMK